MKKLKSIINYLSIGLIISLGFMGGIFIIIKAANLTATTGSPLTASNWNEMISNFFWGSGTGGIYYNGKVGIGTNAPNKSLHIKTTAGTNAELDLQSGDLPHWAIYQDESTKGLAIRNGVIRTSISTGGNLNAQGLCINGVCKTDWNQVGSSISNNYTGTCDVEHKGATGVISDIYKICDGTNWLNLKNFASLGAATNPAYSCYQIKSDNYSSANGTYRIDPNGGDTSDKFQVYCDMTNGGRTLVARIAGNASTHMNTAAVGVFTGVSQSTTYKLSDATINLIPKSFGYKFECGPSLGTVNSQTFGTSCVFSATTYNSNSNCHLGGNSGLNGVSYNTSYSSYPRLGYGQTGVNGCFNGGLAGNNRGKGDAGARRRETGWLRVK